MNMNVTLKIENLFWFPSYGKDLIRTSYGWADEYGDSDNEELNTPEETRRPSTSRAFYLNLTSAKPHRNNFLTSSETYNCRK